MYKLITILILCFAISKPVLAQAIDEMWERLFKFQLEIAEKGDSDAMLILGDMYRKGEGTDVDLNIALYWYNQAARAGNKRADERIELLLKQKNNAKLDQPQPAQEPKKVQRQKPEEKRNKQEDQKAIELETARKKAQQLAEQLARQREEAEKARREMQRLKDLEQQLAQERAAAEKARRDVEVLKSRELQLVQERQAAEQARMEAEKARLELEQTAQNSETTEPAPDHQPDSTSGAQNSSEPAKTNVNTFKSNPCDNPQLRDSYSCKLLNRRR